MIGRADFSRVLVGLEPVIQLPRERARVRCLGFDFYQETSQREPSRFLLPTAEAIQLPTIRAVTRNPVLPPWVDIGWPSEIVPVPYPAEHRWWSGFSVRYDGLVEATWPILEGWTVAEDPLAPAGELVRLADRATRHAFDALIYRTLTAEWPAPGTWGRPWQVPVPVAGDEQSHVPEETIATLVELARQDRYQDFVDLAGAVGVGKAEWDALWRGTRARVGATVEELDPPF